MENTMESNRSVSPIFDSEASPVHCPYPTCNYAEGKGIPCVNGDTLMKHFVEHRVGGDMKIGRLYRCPYHTSGCERVFNSYSATRKHLHVHLTLKPYHCDYFVGQHANDPAPPPGSSDPCYHRFNDPSNLIKHKRSHHGYIPTPKGRAKAGAQVNMTPAVAQRRTQTVKKQKHTTNANTKKTRAATRSPPMNPNPALGLSTPPLSDASSFPSTPAPTTPACHATPLPGPSASTHPRLVQAALEKLCAEVPPTPPYTDASPVPSSFPSPALSGAFLSCPTTPGPPPSIHQTSSSYEQARQHVLQVLNSPVPHTLAAISPHLTPPLTPAMRAGEVAPPASSVLPQPLQAPLFVGNEDREGATIPSMPFEPLAGTKSGPTAPEADKGSEYGDLLKFALNVSRLCMSRKRTDIAQTLPMSNAGPSDSISIVVTTPDGATMSPEMYHGLAALYSNVGDDSLVEFGEPQSGSSFAALEHDPMSDSAPDGGAESALFPEIKTLYGSTSELSRPGIGLDSLDISPDAFFS